MKITAVVVTYNSIKWIQKCIDSLLSSTVEVTVVIVDNASDDETIDFIKSNYPQITLISNDENLGFAAANNIGLKLAQTSCSDFIFLLNHDAWVRSDTIENLVLRAKENSNYGVLSPIHLNASGEMLEFLFSTFISNPSDEGRKFYSDLVLKHPIKKVYEVDFINAAAWLIPIKTIEIVGLFDSLNFPHYGEDNNYLQRLKYFNLKVGLVPSTFAYHDTEDREGKHNDKNFKRHLAIKKFKVCALDISESYNSKDLKNEIFMGLEDVIKAIFKIQFTESISRFKIYREKRELYNNRNSIISKYKQSGFDPQL
ncbi:glycosyltransferase family 2 protein [Fulvivirga sediminis]|uniref:Glycosyltransferase family 2 protein n=1 Tax=Fulvivirga sediminis TaxID=2803949 RepID=A0A937F669_9BACT|nr:glycosyltransferase family 2 protein [Fulvivirga sediminis]MBL3654979.1 glycosyltransferase family 2 protein [Fulvivirga sediminis]